MTKKVALITGAARGIGAATALSLAKEGFDIALNYNSSQTEAKIVAKECEDLGSEVLVVQGDVSKPQECARIVAETITKFTTLDLLVNNAATVEFSKNPVYDLESMSLDCFHKVFDTNVLSALATSQAAAPHLRKSKGVIVNISSVAGITGATNSSIIYATSKGALNTLTLCLAKSLAPDIRVNAICPAAVDSTWWQKKYPPGPEREEFLARIKAGNPLGKIITPESIADIVLFLYGNEHLNGELIRVDLGDH